MKKDKLPIVLQVLSGIGVASTAVLSSISMLKTMKELNKEENSNLTQKEKIKCAIKHYIPTAITGIGTIGCLIMSGKAFDSVYQTLLAAYLTTEESYIKYVEKNVEINGIENHNEIIKRIADEDAKWSNIYACTYFEQCSLDFDDPSPDEFKLFYEPVSKKMFRSTMSRVLQAQYHFNRNFVLLGEVPLNMYLSLLGLDPVEDGDSIGWTCLDSAMDDIYWMDFSNKKEKYNEETFYYILMPLFYPVALVDIDPDRYKQLKVQYGLIDSISNLN